MTSTAPEVERDARSAGFSLIEAAVVSVVMGVLSLMVVQSLNGLSATQAYAEGQARISTLAQRAMQGLLRDTSFAVKVFSEDLSSAATLAMMDSATLHPLSESRMPVTQALGYFEPDGAGPIETGNVLFMACAQKPVVFEVLVEEELSKLRVDRFCFVAWYLSEGCDSLFDLNRWGSMPLARFLDVASIADEQKRVQACSHLRQEGVLYTWDPDTVGPSAFCWISESGVLIPLGTAEGVPEKVTVDPEQSRFSIFATKAVGVAPNGFSKQVRTPFYAEPRVGFPHGFEVKIDGSGMGRLLLIRLALTSNRLGRLPNSSTVSRLTAIRGG